MKRTLRRAIEGAFLGMLAILSSASWANECLVSVFDDGSVVNGLHSIDVSPGYTTWTYEGELYRAGVLMDEDDTASPDQSILWTYAPLTYCVLYRGVTIATISGAGQTTFICNKGKNYLPTNRPNQC